MLPESILVFITRDPDDAIGENFIKLPMLRALRQARPDARITVAYGSPNIYFSGQLKPIVAPLVDELVSFEAADPLAGRRFDAVIDTQEVLSIGLPLALHARRQFVSPVWKGFFSLPRLRRRPPVRLALRLLDLVEALTGERARPDPALPLPEPFVSAAQAILPPDGPPLVLISPGAGNKARGKLWPLDRFIAIANRQIERGRRTAFILGPDEFDWAERLRAAAPGALLPFPDSLDRAPKALRSVLLTVGLARAAAVGVANCSGGGHMLAAGGAPMVSLFGPTSPEKFAPYARRLATLRAPDRIIESIGVDAVDTAIERVLAGGGQPFDAD